MSYEIVFARRAARYYERLDTTTQARMRGVLEAVSGGERGKQLRGPTNQRALRVGGWRIIIRLDDEAMILWVDAIGPRGEVYRDL